MKQRAMNLEFFVNEYEKFYKGYEQSIDPVMDMDMQLHNIKEICEGWQTLYKNLRTELSGNGSEVGATENVLSKGQASEKKSEGETSKGRS